MPVLLRLTCSAACGLLLAGACLAADPRTASKVPAEIKDPFLRVGEIIAALAQNDLDAAYLKYSERLINAPKDSSDFESDLKTGFRKLFDRFPKGIESVDLMAVRRISTRSLKLTCVANSRRGPVIVEAVVYRHGDSWWFCQLGYQPVDVMDSDRLKQFAELMPAEPLADPLSIPLTSDPPGKVSSAK